MSTSGPRETSSATTRLVLSYVREARGDDGVARVLARADVPETLAQLEQDSCWVSYRTRIALFQAVADEFGDPQALFDVGAWLLRASVGRSLKVVLRALGSPAQVYRNAPRAVAKFSTTSTMTVVETGDGHATVDFRLHAGFAHSALDCLYAQGLLSTVPALFGMPPARVVHPECEQDGAPACRYHLTWDRRRRSRRRRGDEAGDLRGQLEALQSAAADLTGSADVATVARRIVERTAATVVAQGYLLTVTPPGAPALVESLGLPDAQREALAARLLAGEDLGPSALVVDVASARRRHGRLAAVYADGQGALPGEQGLLAAYAGHAAAALDLLTALEDSRRDDARAQALLALSHELARAGSTQDVCDLVARALLRVVGCDSAGVLLWHPAEGELRARSSLGLTPTAHEVLMGTPLRPQDVPELMAMLTGHQPLVISKDSAQDTLRALLEVVEVEHLVAVPLVAGDQLVGVTTASWGPGPAPDERTVDLALRLQGVADQAATALRNSELLATVQHQALHDALTGLANRALFSERLEQAVTTDGAAVLFCDLDRFKHVNDAHGHAAGDELLRQVAARLRGVVRDGDTAARLSGDEFAVLLPATGSDEAARVAAALVACFETPFRLDGRELRATASVGVAHCGVDEVGGDVLLRAADAAMYEAKRRGRSQVVVADGAGRAGATQDRSLARELRDGLARDELRLFFQPVFALPAREVVGCEALVRWEHPRLGLLPPSAFLPVAEEAGLVADLDLWVLRQAVRTVAAWTGGPPGVSVNLSSAALVDPRLLPTTREALAESGLPGTRLSLEVVESRSLVDLPGVVDRLVALRQLGAQIALDDFGTGYSTLSLLQQLPATAVKVDRSFVSGLDGADPAPRALVRGVLALARALDLHVVAEGVETEEQLAVLQDEGCRYVQGFLLGRPAPAPAPEVPAPRTAAQPATAGR